MHMTRATKINYWQLGLVFIIMAAGFYLRLTMVTETNVLDPIRADAKQYYYHALNLKMHGIYSGGNPGANPDAAARLRPDTAVNPGYPLFLSVFATWPITDDAVDQILLVQTLIGTATIILAFLVFIRFLPFVLAIIATALVSLSPHLIASAVYVLTETLFTALLVLSAWCFCKSRSPSYKLWS